ncbi:MAG: RsmD family RNA methyltransferase [Dehalococcoidia bacterium]|nr:RsmD family RNA methyltransferase [Dehalococcoidia bacterium]
MPIKYPKGAPTRPATELVRGAIFSMLEASDADWSRVLDLFSGSGSLGIEALSRGAGFVDFVDRDRRAYAIIRENLMRARLAERARIYCQDVSKALCILAESWGGADGGYGIVLMDPPYANRAIGGVITALASSKIVGAETVVVITHSARFKLENKYGSLAIRRELRHGDSVIAVYRKHAGDAPPAEPGGA